MLRHCAGARVQIGYNRRFDAGFVAAREAVRSGELGWLHTIRSTTMDPAPPPAGYIAGSGGIFRDCSVHDFDIIRFVTGREVVEVYATGSNRGDEMFAEAGDAATTGAILPWTTARSAMVSNTRYNGRGYDVRLELHGRGQHRGRAWRTSCRCAPPSPASRSRPGRRTSSSWTASPRRTALELAAFTEVVAGTREIAVHGRRRGRGRLDRRGLHPVAARTPPGRAERGERPVKIAGAPISWGVCEVPGLGLPAAARPGAAGDARGRADRDRVRPGGLPAARPTARCWPPTSWRRSAVSYR